jgi:solute carrier family 25 phosphate transporter 3
MQSNPQKYYQGLIKSTMTILREKGPRFLLSGLGSTIIGYGLEGAVKFGVYECLKPVFLNHVSDQTAVAFLLSSVVAGVIAALLLCPMESIRIRQVSDSEFAKLKVIDAFLKIVIQEGGFLSSFAGLPAMLAKQVPYTMMKQVSFDFIATKFYTILDHMNIEGGASSYKMSISVCSAFLAAILACVGSQPGDMVLTQTYKSQNPQPFSKIIASIYKRDGVSGFFVGTQARLVHVCLIITSQLVIYDVVKQLVGLPATGSH